MRKEFIEFIKKNEKTGDQSLRAILIVMAARVARETGDNSLLSKLLKGNEELYSGCGYAVTDNDKANAIYEKLLNIISKEDTTDVDKALMILPFYTYGETNLGKKEHYQDIFVRFNELNKALTKGKPSSTDITKYLIAVITANEYMSEQLFEYYIGLSDLFKMAYKKYGKNLLSASESDRILVAFALERACDMKVVLREKYADTIEELLR